MRTVGELKFLFYLNLGEGLDNIADLYVVVVDEGDTALESCSNLFDIVFVALQGTDRSGLQYDTVANDSGIFSLAIISLFLCLLLLQLLHLSIPLVVLVSCNYQGIMYQIRSP